MMKVDDCHQPAIVTCSRHLAYVNDRKNVGPRAKVLYLNAQLTRLGKRHPTSHEANTRCYILGKISRSAAYEGDVGDNPQLLLLDCLCLCHPLSVR